MKKPTPEDMLKAMEDPRFGQMLRAFISGDDAEVKRIQDEVEREFQEDATRTVQ
jgi:hypothetical protein